MLRYLNFFVTIEKFIITNCLRSLKWQISKNMMIKIESLQKQTRLYWGRIFIKHVLKLYKFLFDEKKYRR